MEEVVLSNRLARVFILCYHPASIAIERQLQSLLRLRQRRDFNFDSTGDELVLNFTGTSNERTSTLMSNHTVRMEVRCPSLSEANVSRSHENNNHHCDTSQSTRLSRQALHSHAAETIIIKRFKLKSFNATHPLDAAFA